DRGSPPARATLAKRSENASGVPSSAGDLGDDQAGLLPSTADLQPLGGLRPLPPPEWRERRRSDWGGAVASGRLRGRGSRRLAVADARGADGDRRAFEVDVGPPEAEDLAAPHAGRRHQYPHGRPSVRLAHL